MQHVDTSYGSNEDGLIWGYRLSPDAPAEPITTEAVRDFLASGDASRRQDFIWLHFSLANQGSKRYLREVLDLPDAFHDSLASAVGSTRVELDDGALVAVIHDVLFDSTFDASEVGTTSLCIAPRLVVSARLRPLRSVDRLRAAVRSGQTFRSPVELLAHLLRDQANVLGDILRKSTVRVDQIEDRLLANQVPTDRKELGALRRSLVRLQRLLAPEPTALFRLLNRPPAWISRDDVLDLQQAAEEFSAAIGDSSALVERVKLIQEELAALINENTSRTLFVLTVVTVLALPVNLIAGLFGMNVGGVPLTQSAHGFAIVVTALVILTALLAYVSFRRRGD
ncbi:zinc transporter [Pseudoxanthomonas sp. GM95]|uniref:transporter n=1 Tax=Pseudoxanthomonas sp. GM95 TaxID=1881043 RepID=UPI0008BA86B6|nr:transporter [Pseudoxanthomonas sp. GM95]SEL75520.1 zinc transporter [Pseudoxanthomonas sp. GM95]